MANEQASSTRYVGLDVHKREITYCILDAKGKLIKQQSFLLTRGSLATFCRQALTATDEVALESTTNCWAVTDIVQPYVARVVVSNPMATKAIAHSKVKTDKVDSRVLAQLLRCDFLPEVWQPDATTRLRRQLSGRRATLVGQRTCLRNRIRSVLAMRLIEPPMNALFGAEGRIWLDGLTEETIDRDGLEMIASDLRLLDALAQEIARFNYRLTELAYHDEKVKLLMTIPGVSVVVAQALVAAFGDITRFRSPAKAAAYLGLVPRTKQSATSCHHGPITKQGNSNARWMLVQAAQHMHRQPGPLGHFFRRLKRRKNHNIAVVATARKMAMIAWRMLVYNESYRYAPPQSTASKLAKMRVVATGQKRKGGVAKGQKAIAKLPGGSKTIKSLDTVYAEEGLPPRAPRSLGEQRYVERTDQQEFLDKIGSEQIVPRRKQPRQTRETIEPSRTGSP